MVTKYYSMHIFLAIIKICNIFPAFLFFQVKYILKAPLNALSFQTISAFQNLWKDEAVLKIQCFYLSIKTAHAIDFKFCKHISDRLLHKNVPTIFLKMSYSFFIVIFWRILKPHFEQKQSKADHSKNIRKEEKHRHAFQREKNIENHESVCTGAHKDGNSFLPNFDPHFPNIRKVRKKFIIYILKKLVLVLLMNYDKKIWVTALSFRMKGDTETLLRNQLVLYLQNCLLYFHYKT